MKKRILKVFYWFAGLLIFCNILIVATNNTYLYKTLYYHQASLEDYKIFDNRDVPAEKFTPIPLSTIYNKQKLNSDFRSVLEMFRTEAFLVLKNDSIIYEEYWDSFSAKSYLNSFSVSKSIVSLIVGIAIDENKIKSIDQKVTDYIPEYNQGLNAKLTIRHLLTMSAGFDWSESYNNPFTLTARAYFGNDLTDIILHLKVIEEPGKYFNYQSASTLVLAYILEKATGMKPSQYASEKLWKPLGAESAALWSLDKQDGFEKAFCCFNAIPRDFSRIGLLALHKGKFNNQQIVSENYIAESTQPAPLINEYKIPVNCYGFSWWLSRAGNSDIFYAQGILGQYIVVIPEKNLVVLRFGKDNFKVANKSAAQFIAEYSLTHF